MSDLDGLRMKLHEFAAARDWDQFHSPKNLAMALSAESGELLEVFQWLTEEESKRLDAKAKSAAADEIADVLLYLVRLADKLGIDPVAEANRKLGENEQRYPADKARGSAKKSTDL